MVARRGASSGSRSGGSSAPPLADCASMSNVREGRLVRPDDRTVAWSECGLIGGRPVLRLPGTPGSRLSDSRRPGPWVERELRVITVERPGFGVSTRLPGRGFAEHADDLAAILDHLGIDSVPVYGGSGGAPHVLAVRGATPGASPGLRDRRRRRAPHGRRGGPAGRPECCWRQTGAHGQGGRAAGPADDARTSILADPVAGFGEIMDTAPTADHEIMADPAWQAAFARGIREALAPGVDGWLDEALATQRRLARHRCRCGDERRHLVAQ